MPKTFKSTERRHPLNVRTTKDIREKLEAAARASGRSLTQELEHRLEQSFVVNPWAQLDAGGAASHVRETLKKIIQCQSAILREMNAGAKIPQSISDAALDLSGCNYELLEVLRMLTPKPRRNNAVLVDMPGPGEPASGEQK